MTISDHWRGSSYENIMAARVMLRADEGLSRVPYKCPAGFTTIGVGRNLDANPLSDDEIGVILDNDIDRARRAVCEIFTPEFFENIEPERQLALINLVFNLGTAGFLQFKHTIEAIKARDWKRAASEVLNSRYARQVKGRAVRVATMLGECRFPYLWQNE